MEILTIEQYLPKYIQQQNAKEQYEFKKKFYLIAPFVSIFISMIITIIILLMLLLKTNIKPILKTNTTISFILGFSFSLPTAIFVINSIIYQSPVYEFILKKKHRYSSIDYDSIVNEHKKPMSMKYKVRKILLITLNIVSSLLEIGKIVFFIIVMILWV